MDFDTQEIDELFERLFPICRSLTGPGNETSSSILQEIVPELKIREVPSSTNVFDWQVSS